MTSSTVDRLWPPPRVVGIGWIAWGCWWLVSAAVALPLAATSPDHLSSETANLATAALLIDAGLWLLGMFAWGFVLARRRLWLHLGTSVALIVVSLLWLYVVAMAISPDPGADDAAAVGAIFLAVPLSMLVTAIVGLGGLAGAASRRLVPRAA